MMNNNVNYPIVGVCLSLFLFLMVGLVQADLNKGVVAGWTFDQAKIVDSVGKHHGKLFKAAKSGVKGGKFGGCIRTDASKETRGEIMVPGLEKILEKEFTVAYWIFVRQGANHSGIWKGEKVGWGPNFTFRILTTSNANMTWGTCTEGNENWFATDNAIKDKEWIHVCQTYDGSEATGYVTMGGKTVIPPSGQGNPKASKAPLKLFKARPIEIGAGRAIGGNVGEDTFADCDYDDLIIWDRSLEEDEVKSLGKGKRPDQALLVKAHGKLSTTWGQVKSYNTMH